MNKKEVVLVDYYEGGYGPTIRIDVLSVDNLRILKENFVALSQNAGSEVDFLGLNKVLSTGVKKLVLKSVEDSSKKKLIFSNKDTGNVTLDWIMPMKEWIFVVGLAEGLIESGKPGHQYLTSEDQDEIVVELAYMERGDISIPER